MRPLRGWQTLDSRAEPWGPTQHEITIWLLRRSAILLMLSSD